VTTGSIIMRKHQNGAAVEPYLAKKLVEGDILGFADGDDGISLNPLSWFFSGQDNTEVVFLSEREFMELWKL
jgi:hypothetical protein